MCQAAHQERNWSRVDTLAASLIEAGPADGTPYGWRVDALLHLKRFEEAEQVATEMLGAFPNAARSVVAYYQVLFGRHDYDRVIEFYCSEMDPALETDVDVVFFLLRAAQYTGNDELSLRAARRVSARGLGSKRYRNILYRGLALARKAERTDEEAHFQRLLSREAELPLQDSLSFFRANRSDWLPSQPTGVSAFARSGKLEDLRVALCLSGQCRGFIAAHERVARNLIKPLQPDVFIATWDSVGIKNTFSNRDGLSRVIEADLCKRIPDALIEANVLEHLPSLAGALEYWNAPGEGVANLKRELEDLYAPKRCEVFEEAEYDEGLAKAGFSSRFAINQSKMKFMLLQSARLKCEQELENGFPYDLVIRLRLDKNLNKPIPVDEAFMKSLVDTIYVDHVSFHGIGDQIAAGSSEAIDFYSCMGPAYDRFSQSPELEVISGQAAHGVLRDYFMSSPFRLTRTTPIMGGNLNNLVISTSELLERGLQADLEACSDRFDVADALKWLAEERRRSEASPSAAS
jgi:hypothetical protein